MKIASLLLGVVTTASLVLASDVTDFKLGGGYPSLHIVYYSTDVYVVYIDHEYLEYLNWRSPLKTNSNNLTSDVQVVRNRNFFVEPNFARPQWAPRLYPFDDEIAFTCEGGANLTNNKIQAWPRVNLVFSEKDGTIATSRDLNDLARERYGLSTNQAFLGKVGTNIYYFEPPNAKKIYYRPANGKAVADYFHLPGPIVDLFGATKAVSPNKDVAFWGVRKTRMIIMPPTPFDFCFVEVHLRKKR